MSWRALASAAGSDRPPFAFVAVQQLVFCGPVDDHRELPGQVLPVTDAGVHPLTTERAVDMGGITGQQDPAVTVRFGEPPVDPERRNPLGITNQRWIETGPFAQLAGDLGEDGLVGHRVRLGSRVDGRDHQPPHVLSRKRKGPEHGVGIKPHVDRAP